MHLNIDFSLIMSGHDHVPRLLVGWLVEKDFKKLDVFISEASRDKLPRSVIGERLLRAGHANSIRLPNGRKIGR